MKKNTQIEEKLHTEELFEKQVDSETVSFPVLSLSVRGLVEFVLRHGDIREGEGGISSVKAMQEGAKLHRKIQASMGPTYHKEVSLEQDVEFAHFILNLSGRADGIDFDDPNGEVLIDEIKGVYEDVEEMKEPHLLHLAQARCYAAMYQLEHPDAVMSVQITYANIETQKIRRFLYEEEKEDLLKFFYDTCGLYERWGDFRVLHNREYMESLRNLRFPYEEYRPGQKKLMGQVYFALNEKTPLFLQAPTGVGKTISTFYPALKTIYKKVGGRIFYLTAKTITRTVAKETTALFMKQEYKGKTIEIIARDKLCPLEKRSCNPEDCPRAKGHYDRINDAIYELLTTVDLITREDIEAKGEEVMVCPYEMNLDLTDWCDNILCDYNYVFDPNVALDRLFLMNSGECILLIDEAHNLVSRGREMYSADLIKEDVLQLKKYFRKVNFGIPAALERVNKVLLSYKKQCDGFSYLSDVEYEKLMLPLLSLESRLQYFLEKKIILPEQEEILEFYFNLKNLIYLSEDRAGCYRIYTELRKDGKFVLHLYCVDPSARLAEYMERAKATPLFFSATLLPMEYHRRLLCRKEGPYAVVAPSPFSREHLGLFAGNEVTSLYKKRSPGQYSDYADYIYEIISLKKGNYMVFFPSYGFMDRVLEKFERTYGDAVDILVQQQDMTESMREEFLSCFTVSPEEQTPGKSLVAFCVTGGIFGEGIDLTGERLIGVIIAGVALPMVCNEQRVLSDYFEEHEGKGFLYAYLYPGMNRVLQAAGRVIRTDQDRGIVCLLDERFSYGDYKSTYPAEWSHLISGSKEKLLSAVSDFWKKSEENSET